MGLNPSLVWHLDRAAHFLRNGSGRIDLIAAYSRPAFRVRPRRGAGAQRHRMEVNRTMNQLSQRVFVALTICLIIAHSVALAQNLGAAPQVNIAVQGQTGAQPEGAFLNFVNWVGNVIAPVGAGVAVLGAVGSYATGRGVFRWLATGAGLLAISGLTRLIEFWIAQGGAGVR
jgi:hypothetical protein